MVAFDVTGRILSADHYKAVAEQRERYLVALVRSIGKNSAQMNHDLQASPDDQVAFRQWLESLPEIYW